MRNNTYILVTHNPETWCQNATLWKHAFWIAIYCDFMWVQATRHTQTHNSLFMISSNTMNRRWKASKSHKSRHCINIMAQWTSDKQRQRLSSRFAWLILYFTRSQPQLNVTQAHSYYMNYDTSYIDTIHKIHWTPVVLLSSLRPAVDLRTDLVGERPRTRQGFQGLCWLFDWCLTARQHRKVNLFQLR